MLANGHFTSWQRCIAIASTMMFNSGPSPWLSSVENRNFVFYLSAPSNKAGGSILEHPRYDYFILGSVAAVQ
jgi:hypothetical protein